jgi:photosystem II stability/assembly factor-like uncharacterized protein
MDVNLKISVLDFRTYGVEMLLLRRKSDEPLRHRAFKSLKAWSVLPIVLAMTTLLLPVATASASSKSSGHHYVVGGSIAALKLTRLQMLSSQVGVGVAPITTYSGQLVRAFLVRTSDGGASWKITGTFPREFYPGTTAFTTPQEGYVINGTQALFTDNAGRTWQKVAVTAGPVGISVYGDIAWIEVEDCQGSNSMQGPSVTRLESYRVGHLRPFMNTTVPTDQPPLAHVGPTRGYVFGSGGISGNVYATSNSGHSWRAIANPCEQQQITGGSASSATTLFIYCQSGSLGSVNDALFSSSDGGTTWREITQQPLNGVLAASGATGQFLWGFGMDAKLWESSDGGDLWTVAAGVKFGVSGNITTYGASDAWHVVVGHGIYRTLDGTTWNLLK